MKQSRKQHVLHAGVRLSAVLIVVGAVAFASDWSAGVLARKARAARSICSRFALIADKDVRAPSYSSR